MHVPYYGEQQEAQAVIAQLAAEQVQREEQDQEQHNDEAISVANELLYCV
ncbi:hypothetical protein [Agaribacterium haliotis]|nr:hypothetical protein [Agaribacterium haliotis]